MLIELTDEQSQIVETVRKFVDNEVAPVASELDHRDEYPHALVERMKELGLFGATIPEEYGGIGLDYTTYAMVVEELARGWVSIPGLINSHLMMAYIVREFGTETQKRHWLPRFASGELRGGLALSEADAGSDVQAIRTTAKRAGDHYVINGAKMWITNARHGNTFALLAKTDPEADPPHRGMSMFIIEKGHPGFTVSRDIPKLGYRGLKTCELVFEDFPVPVENLVGEREGQGFKYVMSGLETGRINVAARGVGVVRACFEASIRYAQQRRTFGKPIAEHQLIQEKLADMATNLEAARLLTYSAARAKDRGARVDLEAGMAKLFATEAAMEAALEAMRLHGAVGYTEELPIERYFRDAPLLLIGEGTNEIQKTVIARQLLKKYAI
ncbi:MAG: acyl-CoA dehydrogenase family protein [Myxococcota bacterium]